MKKFISFYKLRRDAILLALFIAYILVIGAWTSNVTLAWFIIFLIVAVITYPDKS